MVITGDLIDTANPEDWVSVREALERHGLFDVGRTTVIPGNHDLICLEEELRFYHAFNPDAGGRRHRVQERLQAFCSVFQPLISEDETTVSGFPLVKVLSFGQARISFVAVSTVLPWSGSDNPLGARGYVAESMLQALLAPPVHEAVSGSFVIGLCHHAYRVYGTDALVDQAFDWTMQFKNREAYLQAMKTLGARLIMHGHFHRFQTYEVDGVACINGGSFRYGPERYGELTVGPDGLWEHRFLSLG